VNEAAGSEKLKPPIDLVKLLNYSHQQPRRSRRLRRPKMKHKEYKNEKLDEDNNNDDDNNNDNNTLEMKNELDENDEENQVDESFNATTKSHKSKSHSRAFYSSKLRKFPKFKERGVGRLKLLILYLGKGNYKRGVRVFCSKIFQTPEFKDMQKSLREFLFEYVPVGTFAKEQSILLKNGFKADNNEATTATAGNDEEKSDEGTKFFELPSDQAIVDAAVFREDDEDREFDGHLEYDLPPDPSDYRITEDDLKEFDRRRQMEELRKDEKLVTTALEGEFKAEIQPDVNLMVDSMNLDHANSMEVITREMYLNNFLEDPVLKPFATGISEVPKKRPSYRADYENVRLDEVYMPATFPRTEGYRDEYDRLQGLAKGRRYDGGMEGHPEYANSAVNEFVTATPTPIRTFLDDDYLPPHNPSEKWEKYRTLPLIANPLETPFGRPEDNISYHVEKEQEKESSKHLFHLDPHKIEKKLTRRPRPVVGENFSNYFGPKQQLDLLNYSFLTGFEYIPVIRKMTTVRKAKGRVHSYACMVVVLSKDGFVGYAYAKAGSKEHAENRAKLEALRNLRSVELTNHTIIHPRYVATYRGLTMEMLKSSHRLPKAHPLLFRIMQYLQMEYVNINIHSTGRNIFSVLACFFKLLDQITTLDDRILARGLIPSVAYQKYSEYLHQSRLKRKQYGWH